MSQRSACFINAHNFALDLLHSFCWRFLIKRGPGWHPLVYIPRYLVKNETVMEGLFLLFQVGFFQKWKVIRPTVKILVRPRNAYVANLLLMIVVSDHMLERCKTETLKSLVTMDPPENFYFDETGINVHRRACPLQDTMRCIDGLNPHGHLPMDTTTFEHWGIFLTGAYLSPLP